MLRFKVAHQLQHFAHIVPIGVLVAAHQRVQRQGDRVAQVVIIVLHQLAKDKLKDGAKEGKQRLDHLLILDGLNRGLKAQLDDDLEADRFDVGRDAV